MSKRLGFTDRATITENKDILRYNERLEREAKGLPAEADGRSSGPRRGPREKGALRDRPVREPRPPRPPALDDEQKAVLQAALDAAVGETGLGEAGQAVIARLAEHDSFDKASNAGWEQAAGGHAAERTPAEWDLLRQVWLTVRIALLEAYATFKPELEPTLSRERKQVARLAKTSGSQRKRRPGKSPAEGEPKQGGRQARKPKTPGPPSPADIARRLARGAGAGVSRVAGGPVTPAADAAAAEAAEPAAVDVVEPDLVEPDESEKLAADQELRADHRGVSPSTDDSEAAEGAVVDDDQLKLEI